MMRQSPPPPRIMISAKRNQRVLMQDGGCGGQADAQHQSGHGRAQDVLPALERRVAGAVRGQGLQMTPKEMEAK